MFEHSIKEFTLDEAKLFVVSQSVKKHLFFLNNCFGRFFYTLEPTNFTVKGDDKIKSIYV